MYIKKKHQKTTAHRMLIMRNQNKQPLFHETTKCLIEKWPVDIKEDFHYISMLYMKSSSHFLIYILEVYVTLDVKN